QATVNHLLNLFYSAVALDKKCKIFRIPRWAEMQSGFAFINSPFILKEVKAKVIPQRFRFLNGCKSPLTEDIADSRMFLAHISPPHITALAHARCHRPGAEQGTL